MSSHARLRQRASIRRRASSCFEKPRGQPGRSDRSSQSAVSCPAAPPPTTPLSSMCDLAHPRYQACPSEAMADQQAPLIPMMRVPQSIRGAAPVIPRAIQRRCAPPAVTSGSALRDKPGAAGQLAAFSACRGNTWGKRGRRISVCVPTQRRR